MKHIGHNRKQVRGGTLRVAPAMTLGLAVLLTGCDSLLEVSLPGTITVDDLANAAFAEILTQSAIGTVECSYSRFMNNAAGFEDAWLVFSGGQDVNYEHVVAGTSECGSTLSDNRFTWWDPMQEARFTAEDTYSRLLDWTEEEIAVGLVNFTTREQLLGVNALYASIPYTMFGEHVCEITIELGPLMTPDEVLAIAEGWVDTALGHITTHIAAEVAAGETDADAREYPHSITDDSEMMAYALRARIRWARGDLVNAAADAALVTDGFFAYATRNSGVEPHRANSVYELHHNTGGLGLDARIAPVLDWWVDQSDAGTYPAPAAGWPLVGGVGPEALIPFTGYIDLAIAANGRAVDAVGNAVTIVTDPGATPDTRVKHLTGTLSNDEPGQVQQKYTTGAQPIIMVNWAEMRLIQAEANTASAVAMVNVLRADAGLPAVSYAPNADEIENMIFEERRRHLWLEGRFWSTKIKNQMASGTKLWFPRELGTQRTPDDEATLQGGVRLRMETREFDINPNLNRNLRATGCGPYQRPVAPEHGDI